MLGRGLSPYPCTHSRRHTLAINESVLDSRALPSLPLLYACLLNLVSRTGLMDDAYTKVQPSWRTIWLLLYHPPQPYPRKYCGGVDMTRERGHGSMDVVAWKP